MLYGCTVVEEQCSIVALYCCMTNLPLNPRTRYMVHGHCIVVLETSSNSILHCNILKVNTVFCSLKDARSSSQESAQHLSGTSTISRRRERKSRYLGRDVANPVILG